MNELTTQTTQLPEALPELAKFALVGREKLASVRAEINAIKKVGLAKEVLEQKKAEAQEIAELVTLSEVRIGKMLKEIPKATADNAKKQIAPQDKLIPKAKVIEDIGFSPKQTAQFQTMADHEDIVHEAIEEARKNDDIVSRSEVLKRIKYDKQLKAIETKASPRLKEQVRSGDVSINQAYNIVRGRNTKSPAQMKKEYEEAVQARHEAVQTAKTVSIADAKQDISDKEYLSGSVRLEIAKVTKAISHVYLMVAEKELDVSVLNDSDKRAVLSGLKDAKQQIDAVIERIERG